MHHFSYKGGVLHAEDVSLEALAREVGSPFYCYSRATLERHYRVFAEPLAGLNAQICFAIKANPSLAVIRTFGLLGAGADVVSGGEFALALAAGIPGNKVVFSGVGKTPKEIRFALEAGLMQFNVESLPELQTISQIAGSMGLRAPISLRVNPDIDAGTHGKITTGLKENKFGIEWAQAHRVYGEASKMPGIDIRGLAVHIGSQLTDLEPFRQAFLRVRDLVGVLRADGLSVTRLDLGGGLGIPYDDEVPPLPADYAKVIGETVGDLGCELVLEPGRLLVGNAGILVAEVVYVKEGSFKTFIIVDAGMNDLVRPAMYEAYHDIWSVKSGDNLRKVDIVGPICESSDVFGTDRLLPIEMRAGDLLAFLSAGAYGFSMASNYNARALAAEVMVDGGKFHVIRPRQDFAVVIGGQRLPF